MKPYTIMAVDDDDAQRYALGRILEGAGFDVLRAANGNETLKLADQVPDLIILDVNLPDLNGFEICRRLKANPKTANIPVVFLSATYQHSSAKELANSVGAEAFLFAPVEKQHLFAVVQGALRRRAEAQGDAS